MIYQNFSKYIYCKHWSETNYITPYWMTSKIGLVILTGKHSQW